MNKPITTATLKQKKKDGTPITAITTYDYPSAQLADQAGIDIILVGDSLGMVVLGYDSTIPVTMDDMIRHTQAVTRGTKNAFVVADMPFLSYQGPVEESLKNAGRFMQEGLAKAVKIEGGQEILPVIKKYTSAGIPVMGHIGLTPQSVHQLGGFKVQGKDEVSAQKLIESAKALEEAGAFSIVLECIPAELAKNITASISIPTIGIGAGAGCDGQILVFHDLLGYASAIQPKFVKKYANIGETIQKAIGEYIEDVKRKRFPTKENEY